MNYEQEIARLDAFVREMGCVRPLRARSDELLQTLDALSIQRKNLQGALLITLVGGTGVGKSTLLNALAGREIAEVSPIRPCTTVTTYYSHRENDLGPISTVIAPTDRIIVNEAEGLRGKIVADPPDFDSMLQSNRRKLLEVLKVADLVICVVDPEKYGNLSLYRLLRRFRHGRSFFFVMNKADFGIAPAAIEDFRALAGGRVFTISARERSGDYAALEDLIRREIDRAAIQKIKNSNLEALVDHTRGTIRGLLPADLEKRIAEIPRLAERDLADASERIASELSRSLFEEDPRVRRFVMSASGLSIGGLFGMYLAAAGKIGSLLTASPSASKAQDPVELRVLIRNALEKSDAGRIRLLLDRVGSETAARLGALEIDVTSAPIPNAAQVAGEFTAATVDFAAARTTDFVEHASEGFVGTLLYNLLPFGWLAYCFWRLIDPGSERPIDLVAAVAILFGIFILQHPVAERGFRRRGGRFIRKLRSELEERVKADLEKRLIPSIRAFADSLTTRLRSIR